jgi:hypothetical protein
MTEDRRQRADDRFQITDFRVKRANERKKRKKRDAGAGIP